MADVNSNFVTLAHITESAPGVADTGSAKWVQDEYNPGALRIESNVSTVTRTPVSKNRQRRAGAPVSREAGVGFDTDVTLHTLEEFFEAFFYARGEGPGRTDGAPFRPTAVTGSVYTIPDENITLAQNRLVRGFGFPNNENNGLKLVGAGASDTTIPTSGLVADASVTDPENATVELCGVQGATSDITFVSGDIVTTLLDCTTLGLTDGQWIKVGGVAAATQFATAAYNGCARVRGTVTTTTIPLDRHSFTPGSDNGSGKTIQLFFGRHFQQRDVDNADAIERTYTFEYSLPDMDGAATDRFGYVEGCYPDEMTLTFPLQDKAGMALGFMALAADPPVVAGSRLTGASAMRRPVKTSPFITSTDYARLSVAGYDETAMTTTVKSWSLTIRNNVAREYVQGTFDAAKVAVGSFEVDIELEVWFDSAAIAQAVADNTTCSFNALVQNQDGGFYIDIPECKLGGGSPSFPAGQTVTLSTTVMAHQDSILGYTLGISTFPYLPPL